MKKKLFLGIGVLLLSACGNTVPKEDGKLVCYLASSTGDQSFSGEVQVGFNEDSGIALNAVYSEKYDFLEKSETNNKILANYIDRNSILSDLEGAKIALDIQETAFAFVQTWDYTKVDVSEATNAEILQEEFVKEDAYAVDKIKEYYETQMYSCEFVDVE